MWLEPVPQEFIETLEITPEFDEKKLRLKILTSNKTNNQCKVIVLREGKEIIRNSVDSNCDVEIPLGEDIRTWSPKDPFLYDLKVSLDSGDEVSSYFGMRKIEMRKVGDFQRIFLNNELLPFQAGPLDQVYGLKCEK